MLQKKACGSDQNFSGGEKTKSVNMLTNDTRIFLEASEIRKLFNLL